MKVLDDGSDRITMNRESKSMSGVGGYFGVIDMF